MHGSLLVYDQLSGSLLGNSAVNLRGNSAENPVIPENPENSQICGKFNFKCSIRKFRILLISMLIIMLKQLNIGLRKSCPLLMPS